MKLHRSLPTPAKGTDIHMRGTDHQRTAPRACTLPVADPSAFASFLWPASLETAKQDTHTTFVDPLLVTIRDGSGSATQSDSAWARMPGFATLRGNGEALGLRRLRRRGSVRPWRLWQPRGTKWR